MAFLGRFGGLFRVFWGVLRCFAVVSGWFCGGFGVFLGLQPLLSPRCRCRVGGRQEAEICMGHGWWHRRQRDGTSGGGPAPQNPGPGGGERFRESGRGCDTGTTTGGGSGVGGRVWNWLGTSWGHRGVTLWGQEWGHSSPEKGGSVTPLSHPGPLHCPKLSPPFNPTLVPSLSPIVLNCPHHGLSSRWCLSTSAPPVSPPLSPVVPSGLCPGGASPVRVPLSPPLFPSQTRCLQVLPLF